MSIIFRRMPGIRLLPVLIGILWLADVCAQTNDSSDIVNNDCYTESLAVQPPGDYYDHAEADELIRISHERPPFWLFVIFALQLGLLAAIRAFYAKDMEEMVRALMNLNIAQQLFRDQEKTVPVSSILFSVNLVISTGVLLYLVAGEYGWFMQESRFAGMLFSIWLVMVVFSVRYGILRMVAWIFPFGKILDFYNFNFFLALKMLGVVLVPVNLVLAYSSQLVSDAGLIFGFAAAVLTSGLVIVKGWRIGLDVIRENKFHFIIYICTLEIAPVCILFKAVAEWVI